MKKNSGFTLVELLIVITIMSILTVITVGQFQNARKKARDVQRKGDISAMAKALEMYYADFGTFPADINGETDSDSWGSSLTDGSGYVYMKTLPVENYLRDVPYCYSVTVDGKKFGVFSALENEEDSDYNKMSANKTINYSCQGNRDYNFAILSPNAILSDLPQ